MKILPLHQCLPAGAEAAIEVTGGAVLAPGALNHDCCARYAAHLRPLTRLVSLHMQLC